MSDSNKYIPHQEGPLFPDESKELAEDIATFLDARDRDVESEVAKQNRRDMAEASYKEWMFARLKDMGIVPPKIE